MPRDSGTCIYHPVRPALQSAILFAETESDGGGSGSAKAWSVTVSPTPTHYMAGAVMPPAFPSNGIDVLTEISLLVDNGCIEYDRSMGRISDLSRTGMQPSGSTEMSNLRLVESRSVGRWLDEPYSFRLFYAVWLSRAALRFGSSDVASAQ